MENDVKSIEDLQKELDTKAQKVSDATLIFFDLSSSCTGYSLAQVNFIDKSASFIKAGCMWFGSDWSEQEKYHYLFKTICEYFYIVDKVDHAVSEAYMINMKKRTGLMIGPELHGVLKVALAEVGLKHNSITSQTWRSQLGIKPIISVDSQGKSKRDYKKPTEDYFRKLINVPTHIKSNITKNLREIPNDVFDSLGVGAGFLNKIGIKNIKYDKIQIQPDVN